MLEFITEVWITKVSWGHKWFCKMEEKLAMVLRYEHRLNILYFIMKDAVFKHGQSINDMRKTSIIINTRWKWIKADIQNFIHKFYTFYINQNRSYQNRNVCRNCAGHTNTNKHTHTHTLINLRFVRMGIFKVVNTDRIVRGLRSAADRAGQQSLTHTQICFWVHLKKNKKPSHNDLRYLDLGYK